MLILSFTLVTELFGYRMNLSIKYDVRHKNGFGNGADFRYGPLLRFRAFVRRSIVRWI